ncbi:MAG: hypothetical protein WCK43_07035, partial [bacterium]
SLINPREIFEGVSYNLDNSIEKVIVGMTSMLQLIAPERADRLHAEYADVYRSMEFSSTENKNYLFDDLVMMIDLSLPAGWTFGPEEEFSVLYLFSQEPSD